MPGRAPRVTVGMPVYNSAKWLGQSIESILDQTFSDLELVISDNASTDESWEIARHYAEKDSRVRLFRNPTNVGVGNNYSLLVGYARGQYFKWASSNDVCDPTFIEKCVHALDARPDIGLCCAKTKLFVDIPETGTEYRLGVQTSDEDPIVRFRHIMDNTGLNNAMNGLIRMEVLRQTRLIRPHYASDITLLGEIALRSKLLELSEVLFFRRFDRGSATSLQDALTVRQYHFPTAGVGMFFQTWRRCWGCLGAISRADLTLSQRVRGLMYIARRWYWARGQLYADLKEAVTALSRRWSTSRR